MTTDLTETVRSFYAAHREALVSYALALTGSKADAEDVVQSVISRLLRRRRAPRELRPFVFRSIRNEAIDRSRCIRRDQAHDVAGTDSVDERLEADEAAAIRECVQQLAIEDQEIVILKAVAGFTFREIATIQGRNQNSVASRYRRVLERIQEELGGR